MRDFLSKLKPWKISILIGSFVFILIFAFYLIFAFSGNSTMGVLYPNLGLSESGKVISKLEQMGVPYIVKGSSILVPSDEIGKIKMQLAEYGIAQENHGYEIFDNKDIINNLTYDVHRIRALEGELARSIETLASVHKARVHIVMPKRSIFDDEKYNPTASVVLNLYSTISSSQVKAISSLVAHAVPQMNMQDVSVIDGNGNLLSHNSDEEINSYEQQKSKSIEALLEKFVGIGNVKVVLNIDMDKDKITENSEIFDPDGKVLRSSEANEEQSQTDANSGTVTVQNNLPDIEDIGIDNKKQNVSKKNQEHNKYEISKTIKTRIKDTGTIKRITAAVLVNGRYIKKDKEEYSYEPRTQDELDKISALVKQAIGFSKDRGDMIEVTNMQFSKQHEQTYAIEDRNYDWNEIAIIAAGVFCAILLIIFFARKIVFVRKPQVAAPMPFVDKVAQDSHNLDELAKIKNTEVEIRASSVKKLNDIVDQNIQEAINVLKAWLKKD